MGEDGGKNQKEKGRMEAKMEEDKRKQDFKTSRWRGK